MDFFTIPGVIRSTRAEQVSTHEESPLFRLLWASDVTAIFNGPSGGRALVNAAKAKKMAAIAIAAIFPSRISFSEYVLSTIVCSAMKINLLIEALEMLAID